VLLSVLFIGLLLIGEVPLGGRSPDDTHWTLAVTWTITMFLVVITLLKGKFWTALLGIMIPFFVFVGAIRLARPRSVWSRWRYEARPKRMARAVRREARWHGRMDRFRIRTMEFIGGAPTLPEVPQAVSSDEPSVISATPPDGAVTRDGATP
jgi:lysyl-tRNA synthetase class 2